MAVGLVRVSRLGVSRLIAALVFIIAATVLLVAMLGQLDDLSGVRRYVSPQIKAAVLVAGAVALAAIVTFLVMHVAVGLRWLAVLYGVERRGRPVLCSPFGLFGYRRQGLELNGTSVDVRVELSGDPDRPVRTSMVCHLYVSQPEREGTLHVSTFGVVDDQEFEAMRDWLAQRGVDLVVARGTVGPGTYGS